MRHFFENTKRLLRGCGLRFHHRLNHKQKSRLLIVGASALMVFSACSSLDCTLGNTVRMNLVLKGEVEKMTDTLTIKAIISEDKDTIVYNKGVNISKVSLPLSYSQEVDQFALIITTADNVTTFDTLQVAKTNQPHFESVECSPSFFHIITDVKCSKHRLESTSINHANVDRDATQEHLYLYFRP